MTPTEHWQHGASSLVTDVYRDSRHVTYSYDTFGRLKTYKPTTGPISGVSLWVRLQLAGAEERGHHQGRSRRDRALHDLRLLPQRLATLDQLRWQQGRRVPHNALGLLSQIDFYNGATATGAYDVYSYDSGDPRNFLKTITMHYKDAGGQMKCKNYDNVPHHGHADRMATTAGA